MPEPKKIKCPECGKLCGEWDGDHVNIKKAKLLVYGAESMPRICPRCGTLFDMVQLMNGHYIKTTGDYPFDTPKIKSKTT